MESLFLSWRFLEENMETLAQMDRASFLSVVGMMIDLWGGTHGLDSEQTCEMMRELMEVQAQVHEELGMAM